MFLMAHDEGMVQSLLGRPSPQLPEAVKSEFSGKTVVVTGGGGSIGSALCIQLAQCRVGRLIILESCEFNLYAIDHLLTRDYRHVQVIPVLCDVLNRGEVKRVFASYPVDYVFHAAALKHVPMVERNPMRGLLVNAKGTDNVASVCAEYKVPKFLLVSTDKAVNPTNIMGVSKRIAETVAASYTKEGIEVRVVRFGNVLWSSGSVLPLFHDQLKRGLPVTLTDERVTRYFMSVREAVQLILRASQLDHSGTFIFDMGDPIRIKDMITRLADWCKITDYSVDVVGLRPGEKLYEELTLGSGLVPTSDAQIMYAKGEDWSATNCIEELESVLRLGDLLLLRKWLVDHGLGYEPEGPIVDRVWVDSQVNQVNDLYGDMHENLWKNY